MRSETTRYQARRHPVATFLVILILVPYILAGALLMLALWTAIAALCLVTGNAEFLRRKR